MTFRSVVVVGLGLLVAAVVVCAQFYVPRIEGQLEEQGRTVLGDAGLDGVVLDVDGRFATLTGVVASANDQARAAELVESVWGMVLVNNLLQVRDGAAEVGNGEQKPREELIRETQAGLDEMLEGRTVGFALGSATLTPDGEELLEQIAALLLRAPGVDVSIEGHTDTSGDAQANQLLSAARAARVRTYLVEKGVAASRLMAAGYGDTRPIATNNTPEGRRQNRRVVFEAR